MSAPQQPGPQQPGPQQPGPQQPGPQQPGPQQPGPQQPYQQQPYQQVPQGYELKKKKPIYKKVWFWLLVILAIIIVAAVAGSGGSSDNGVSGEGSGGGGGETASSGPDFQGKQDGDLSAEAGQTITLDDIATTATPLVAGDSFGSSVLCTTVTLVNNGDDAAPFNPFEFNLQDPAGASSSPTFGGSENTLNSGELAPGGTVTGDVCFDGGAPGQYALIYEPAFSFSSDRAVWVNNR